MDGGENEMREGDGGLGDEGQDGYGVAVFVVVSLVVDYEPWKAW